MKDRHSERGRLGAKLLHYGRRVFPTLISFGLIAWLIWTVTPEKLVWALSQVPWPWLVLATLVQLVALFLWDTVSLWWLFSQPNRPLPFRTVLRARTDSILWSAVNLEIGQAVFAAKLAAAQKQSLLAALGRCMLLAGFDTGTLTALGLFGSFLKPTPLTEKFRWVCGAIVLVLIGLGLAAGHLPERGRKWLQSREWADWFAWWSWRRSFRLALQRLFLDFLVLTYAGVGLAICGVPEEIRTVAGVVPFVLLAEALPGTGGLGERETALVYLLGATQEQRAQLLSFGLIWSTVIILGRVAIGLVSSWVRPARSAGGESGNETG